MSLISNEEEEEEESWTSRGVGIRGICFYSAMGQECIMKFNGIVLKWKKGFGSFPHFGFCHMISENSQINNNYDCNINHGLKY